METAVRGVDARVAEHDTKLWDMDPLVERRGEACRGGICPSRAGFKAVHKRKITICCRKMEDVIGEL